MDELWSYVKNKEKQLWVFIGLESKTKFWVNFELGSRTTCTANRLVKNIKRLGRWGQCLLIVTTDKLAAYKNALEKHMHDTPYAYLQIVKRKFKRKLITVKKLFVKGTESDFPKKNSEHIFYWKTQPYTAATYFIPAKKNARLLQEQGKFQYRYVD